MVDMVSPPYRPAFPRCPDRAGQGVAPSEDEPGSREFRGVFLLRLPSPGFYGYDFIF